VHQAEGQVKGWPSDLSYTRHHGEDWLEVKLEMNQGWQAETTQIDSINHQGGININSTEISAESLKSKKNPKETPSDLSKVFPSCFEEENTILTRTASF
jgi:hypothetical protein